MEVLVTGRGTSGSWTIRGEQLGKSIGARVERNVNAVGNADLAILVKRPTVEILSRVRQAGIPLIWDVVDAWPQPAGNAWSREQCIRWLGEQVKAIKPAGIVAATQAMAQDCEGFGIPVLALPHHFRPGLQTNAIRPLKVLGYEGAAHYLGRWLPFIQRQCVARGLQLVINPAQVSDVDILLALRDCDGYAPKHWKSNVKLANAHGSGTPVICNREAGYLETASGAEEWADDEEEFAKALDALTPMNRRQEASTALQSAAPGIEDIAKTYRDWLTTEF